MSVRIDKERQKSRAVFLDCFFNFVFMPSYALVFLL